MDADPPSPGMIQRSERHPSPGPGRHHRRSPTFISSRVGLSDVQMAPLNRVLAGAGGGVALLSLIGNFFSSLLPTSVGGDAVRVRARAMELPEAGARLSSVVLDRGFGLAAIVRYLGVGTLLASDMLVELAGRPQWTLRGWPWCARVLLLVVAAFRLVYHFLAFSLTGSLGGLIFSDSARHGTPWRERRRE